MRMPCDKCNKEDVKLGIHLRSECSSFKDENENGYIWLCSECWKDEQYKRQEK